jgi:hypothetical protein
MTVPQDHRQFGDRARPADYEPTSRIDSLTEAQERRDEVVGERRARFGGVKVGSAFFGWLTATGMTVILTSLLAGVGVAVGAATGTTMGTATPADQGTVGLVGAIVLGVVVLIGYFCGGYVAGRMARFNGAKQGAAVWLWAIVFAIVIGIVAAVFRSDVATVSGMTGLPQLPVAQGDLTTAGVVALIVVALTSLVGAVLGGLAGMRYHRAIDRAAQGA